MITLLYTGLDNHISITFIINSFIIKDINIIDI